MKDSQSINFAVHTNGGFSLYGYEKSMKVSVRAMVMDVSGHAKGLNVDWTKEEANFVLL